MDVPAQTDRIVADFTKQLLGLAVREKVPFDAVKPDSSKSKEIGRTMAVNDEVVKKLLRRK